MGAYLFRRILYGILVLVGVNMITFGLFFFVNSPDDMARAQLGLKRVTPAAVEKWKVERGYDKPLFVNNAVQGFAKVNETIFYEKTIKLFAFEFGESDQGRNIGFDIANRMWPSLAVQLPAFMIGLPIYLSFALLMAFLRSTYVDIWGVLLCVLMMSISAMFYIIAGQYFFGKLWNLVPISGYDTGFDAIKFLALPILISVISGLGSNARWYRTIFLEEMSKDYVRTARAKGLPEHKVLFFHVLKNALIPILTGVVALIPMLFMGALITESFFGIPGLGSYTIDAITQQDFAIVRAMVFLGSVLYIIGLILTDISYTLVDPRVRLS